MGNFNPLRVFKPSKDLARLNYESDPLFYKRKEERSSKLPGNKFNRSQIDALIEMRNLGVSTGLMSPKEGDMFIANQMVESRNDFAVNTLLPGGQLNAMSRFQGRNKEALKTLYGIEGNPTEDQFIHRLAVVADKGNSKFVPQGTRLPTRDQFSPYTEEMTPEMYQDNARLALLTWLSKADKGESPEKITRDWNGGLNSASLRHLNRVKQARQDLLHTSNESLRQYISNRLSDSDSVYSLKKTK